MLHNRKRKVDSSNLFNNEQNSELQKKIKLDNLIASFRASMIEIMNSKVYEYNILTGTTDVFDLFPHGEISEMQHCMDLISRGCIITMKNLLNDRLPNAIASLQRSQGLTIPDDCEYLKECVGEEEALKIKKSYDDTINLINRHITFLSNNLQAYSKMVSDTSMLIEGLTRCGPL